jgi:hypothetical protein
MLINDRKEKEETGLNLRAMRRDLLQDQDEAGGSLDEYEESSDIALQDEVMEDFVDESAGQVDDERYEEEEDEEVDYKYYDLANGDPRGSDEKSLTIDVDDWLKYNKEPNVPLAFLLFIASIVVSLVFGERQRKSARQKR